ncbi:MAG: SRPBCC family protein [Burkholderiales bacterium]|nr:SRPBCC family protein [Burkholderiales bacterium]
MVLIATVLAVLLAIELTGWLVLPSWSIAASAVSPARPQQIWDWYVDMRDWPHWDHLVDAVESTGPFKSGTLGTSRSGGLTMRSELADVRDPDAYTEVLHLPLATLTATHVLTPTHEGTRIEHGMTVEGPAAWILFLLQRRVMQEGMNDAIHRLAMHAADGLPTRRLP